MPMIVHRLPLVPRYTLLSVCTEENFPVRKNQIVIWISLLEPREKFRASENHPYFPTLLDTGFGHNLHISKRHLNHWAEKETGALTEDNPIEINGRLTPLYRANLAVYRNLPNAFLPDIESEPFVIELDRGIAVDASPGDVPRIPLLGMHALRSANLKLLIDFASGCVSIKTPK